jgi:hypothetical protein
MHQNRILTPEEVLGRFQLSEAEHKRRSDLSRKQREATQPAPPRRCQVCGIDIISGTECDLCRAGKPLWP